MNWWILDLPLPPTATIGFYILTMATGYLIPIGWRSMDESVTEKQLYGRRFQSRKRILYAGNTLTPK